jgi:hypothetical protein
MASLVLSGDTSGSITVSAPAVAGSTTQTLVNVTGTLAPIVSGTAQVAVTNFTTSADFTGIPDWVKRITVIFNAVSLSGTDAILIQIGDSGGVETTGYSSAVAFVGSSTGGNSRTDGYVATVSGTAANTYAGAVTIVNISGNTWVATGNTIYESTSPTGFVMPSTGIKTLSAQLDRVSVTRTGTNTFDAGTINIIYE